MKPLTAIWVTIPAVAASLVVLENVASNTSRTARRKAGPANRRYESETVFAKQSIKVCEEDPARANSRRRAASQGGWQVGT